MKNHISRQEDRMDGLEDGLNLCFQEKNDLEQAFQSFDFSMPDEGFSSNGLCILN
jgi:hypothetical protein